MRCAVSPPLNHAGWQPIDSDAVAQHPAVDQLRAIRNQIARGLSRTRMVALRTTFVKRDAIVRELDALYPRGPVISFATRRVRDVMLIRRRRSRICTRSTSYGF